MIRTGVSLLVAEIADGLNWAPPLLLHDNDNDNDNDGGIVVFVVVVAVAVKRMLQTPGACNIRGFLLRLCISRTHSSGFGLCWSSICWSWSGFTYDTTFTNTNSRIRWYCRRCCCCCCRRCRADADKRTTTTVESICCCCCRRWLIRACTNIAVLVVTAVAERRRAGDQSSIHCFLY